MENKPPANFYRKLRTVILILALVVLSGNIGYRLGNKSLKVETPLVQKPVVNVSPPPGKDVDFSLFWEVWRQLELKYLDKTKLDSQKMVYGAISGMVGALGDPYTVFLPPKENNDFKQDLSGNFEGIGAQLGSKEDKVVVVAPLKGLPAEKAGILAGDWIMKVNGEETTYWTVPETVNKIRGPKGTQVKLTVVHEGQSQPVEISVVRDTITVKSIELELQPVKQSVCVGECGYIAIIKLSRFGDQTNDEWNAAISTIKDNISQGKKIAGVVLDMRNNPGGYFQSAVYVASEFLNSGVVVIQENSDASKETYSVNRVGNLLDKSLVVLINKGSASAAEIVAGALRDHKRAKLIGEKTFGKGSIQTPEDLPDGSGIHITTARWVMPNGEWLNGNGISPDIEIKNSDATGSADLQLERAVSELSK